MKSHSVLLLWRVLGAPPSDNIGGAVSTEHSCCKTLFQLLISLPTLTIWTEVFHPRCLPKTKMAQPFSKKWLEKITFFAYDKKKLLQHFMAFCCSHEKTSTFGQDLSLRTISVCTCFLELDCYILQRFFRYWVGSIPELQGLRGTFFVIAAPGCCSQQ